MEKIKITVMRKARYDDLIEKYENPMEHACDLEEGQVFICDGWQKPDGFCDSAWDSVSPFVMTLAHGGEDFYDGWMKNKKSAMISCNDGFRPVSFLIEVLCYSDVKNAEILDFQGIDRRRFELAGSGPLTELDIYMKKLHSRNRLFAAMQRRIPVSVGRTMAAAVHFRLFVSL